MTAAARSPEAVRVSAAIAEGAERLRLILPELRDRDVRDQAAAAAVEDMRAARATPRRQHRFESIDPMPSMLAWAWDASLVAWDDV